MQGLRDVTQCSWKAIFQGFMNRTTYIDYPEDGGNTFLRNVRRICQATNDSTISHDHENLKA
jgi:hypothetical protein